MTIKKKQDINAISYGAANVATRALYKSRSQYNNASWDLIDAYDTSKSIQIDKSDLPKPYQHLSPREVQQKINVMRRERPQYQDKIKNPGDQRREYIELEKNTTSKNGLDNSMIEALQDQFNKLQTTTQAVLPVLDVDYNGFLAVTNKVAVYRQSRIIDLETFLSMATDEKTIILDTRSLPAYREKHV